MRFYHEEAKLDTTKMFPFHPHISIYVCMQLLLCEISKSMLRKNDCILTTAQKCKNSNLYLDLFHLGFTKPCSHPHQPPLIPTEPQASPPS